MAVDASHVQSTASLVPVPVARFYARSARWEANFFPSVYQGVRLCLVHGDWPRAAAILDDYTRRFPMQRGDRDVLILRDALAAHTAPPDKEFVIVSS